MVFFAAVGVIVILMLIGYFLLSAGVSFIEAIIKLAIFIGLIVLFGIAMASCIACG